MTRKLIQRHLLKGIREFELVDDHVDVRTKVPFRKEEVLTVMLNVLDPEPVISKSFLAFNSRVNGEPLISLFVGKPNTKEFSAFAGLKSNAQSLGLGANVYGEPPESDNSDQDRINKVSQGLDPAKINEAILLLKQYMEPEDTEALVRALEALEEDPKNEALLVQAVNAFSELGPNQGAALTYAPYVSIVLSGGPVEW
jgi:hypothetical protein